MNDELTTQFLKHINSTIEWYREASNYEEDRWIDDAVAFGIIARAKNIIERVGGKDSAYYEQMQMILKLESAESYKAKAIVGVLVAIRGDLLDGYLSSIPQLIHGTLFTDFLDMARHLLIEGYKDAAAVIAGGVLEAHLRQLCLQNGISVELSESSKSPRPKKASKMNEELGNSVYSLFDQKTITAWLDLRNSAAHGKYSEYTENQTEIFIEGLQDFIARKPA